MRVAMLAHFGQLALQHGQLRDAVLGVAGQARAGGVGADAQRVVRCQKQLADGCQMQGRPPADGAHHLHARAFAEGAFDVDDFVALAHAQVDRLLDQAVQLAHGRQRRVAHVQTAFDQVAKLQQTHAQAVTARLGAVNVTANRQIVQDAMGSGGVQAGFVADVFKRNGFFFGRQHVDQREHTLDHLNRRGCGNACGGFCHGVFLIVTARILSGEIKNHPALPATHSPLRKICCGAKCTL